MVTTCYLLIFFVKTTITDVYLLSRQVSDDAWRVTKQANLLIAALIINTAFMVKKGVQSGKTEQSNFHLCAKGAGEFP
ncbi:hypothetical protein [Serratia sp. (in: enterobacteria)]|uniref:hypothetical protein n=1 Tax=Serratia sp. (in: enterobacteria) TaxID=616 RepID=UPI00398946F8